MLADNDNCPLPDCADEQLWRCILAARYAANGLFRLLPPFALRKRYRLSNGLLGSHGPSSVNLPHSSRMMISLSPCRRFTTQ